MQYKELNKLVLQLHNLWQCTGNDRKNKVFIVIILMFFSAITETICLGALIPFLLALSAPEKITQYAIIKYLATYFSWNTHFLLIRGITSIFLGLCLFSGFVRLILAKILTRFTFRLGADISQKIFEKTIYQPYILHAYRNSSEVISALTSKSNSIIFDVILPSLILINSIILTIFISASLIFINPKVALGGISLFFIFYLFIAKIEYPRLCKNSEIISRETNNILKLLQESFHGIRCIILDNLQPILCGIYKKSNFELRNAQGKNLFIGQSPRYIIETLGIVSLISLAFVLNYYNGIEGALPILGALAFSIQRLLPAFQQAYNSWSLITGNIVILDDVLKILKTPEALDLQTAKNIKIALNHSLLIKQLSFEYPNSRKKVLHIEELVITKGMKIGITGQTGAGKSTFVDLIMGLLIPKKPCIFVDNIRLTPDNISAWQKNISHVPQNLYLTDNTFAENIAFGIPIEKIDLDRVKAVAELVQMSSVIESLPNGYFSTAGENAIQLSGGQRQRIALARALYKNTEILILDEATSALDTETEKLIMEVINSLDKTIFIISHKMSNLLYCDRIFKIQDGKLFENTTEVLASLDYA